MWTQVHRRTYERVGGRYPSDMTDGEWARLTWASWGQELLLTHGKIPSLGCLGLVHRSVSDSAIHLTASIIGETGSILSRMQSTGFAGASEARVLDRVDPLATLAAKR